jgi:hypothetical protein
MKEFSDEHLEINIISFDLASTELEEMIKANADFSKHPITFSLQPKLERYRTIDPTVLVAIVSASEVAISALIAGLLRLVENQKNQKIIIQSKDGSKIEIPVGTSPETITELVKQLRYMDSPRIIL